MGISIPIVKGIDDSMKFYFVVCKINQTMEHCVKKIVYTSSILQRAQCLDLFRRYKRLKN